MWIFCLYKFEFRESTTATTTTTSERRWRRTRCRQHSYCNSIASSSLHTWLHTHNSERMVLVFVLSLMFCTNLPLLFFFDSYRRSFCVCYASLNSQKFCLFFFCPFWEARMNLLLHFRLVRSFWWAVPLMGEYLRKIALNYIARSFIVVRILFLFVWLVNEISGNACEINEQRKTRGNDEKSHNHSIEWVLFFISFPNCQHVRVCVRESKWTYLVREREFIVISIFCHSPCHSGNDHRVEYNEPVRNTTAFVNNSTWTRVMFEWITLPGWILWKQFQRRKCEKVASNSDLPGNGEKERTKNWMNLHRFRSEAKRPKVTFVRITLHRICTINIIISSSNAIKNGFEHLSRQRDYSHRYRSHVEWSNGAEQIFSSNNERL